MIKKKEGEHDGSGGAYGAAPHKHRWLHILWSLAVHSAIEGDIYKESHAIPMNSLFTELFFTLDLDLSLFLFFLVTDALSSSSKRRM